MPDVVTFDFPAVPSHVLLSYRRHAATALNPWLSSDSTSKVTEKRVAENSAGSNCCSAVVSAAYIKVYLLENGICVAKKKTKSVRKSLDPLYNQVLVFSESPQGKVVQVRHAVVLWKRWILQYCRWKALNSVDGRYVKWQYLVFSSPWQHPVLACCKPKNWTSWWLKWQSSPWGDHECVQQIPL